MSPGMRLDSLKKMICETMVKGNSVVTSPYFCTSYVSIALTPRNAYVCMQ